jgi:DNA recombination protein RmuC
MEILTVILALALGILAAWAFLTRGRSAPVPEAPEQSAEALIATVGQEFQKATQTLAELNRSQREAETEAQMARLREVAEPLKGDLKRLQENISRLDRDRASTSTELKGLMHRMSEDIGGLRNETGSLVKALRRPELRGSWGEAHLRRVLELAGMVEYCDFDLQQTLRGEDGSLRPDCVLSLAGGGKVPVDSKVSLDAYLDATEAMQEGDAEGAEEALGRHARQVRTHIDTLASKRYQDQFPVAPDLVVMFMPTESTYQDAARVDPQLFDYAMSKGVIVATPMTSLALFRTIYLGWREQSVAETAREALNAARTLHERFGSFLGAFAKLGRQLGSAVTAYNGAVGSVESRVLPQLRRIESATGSTRDIEAASEIDTAVRELAAPELEPGPIAELRPAPGDEQAAA